VRAHISQPPAAGSSHLISSHRMSGHVMPVRLAVTFASRKVTSRRPSVHLMEVPSGEPPFPPPPPPPTRCTAAEQQMHLIRRPHAPWA